MAIGEILLLVFVFVIAGFLGVELISKVPSQLHTPLMSGTNAISGITIVGAISATAVALHTEGMLSNPNFVNKAPAAKVEAERGKLEKYRSIKKQVEEQLKRYR